MSKRERKNINRTLAAALRAYGLTPNGQVWTDAKALVAQGFTPKQAARLVRSTLPDAEQEAAIAKVKGRIERAPVTQAPTPERKLSSRAQEVKAGRVLRDAKGRLVSKDIQEALEILNA